MDGAIQGGKVRDVYALDRRAPADGATDRLSAFDVVLPDPIPGKGEMLTDVELLVRAHGGHLWCPNHLTGDDAARSVLPVRRTNATLYRGRSVVAMR
jgi:phosphoribosylaminoimidazole-succinocarboxamide synthase